MTDFDPRTVRVRSHIGTDLIYADCLWPGCGFEMGFTSYHHLSGIIDVCAGHACRRDVDADSARLSEPSAAQETPVGGIGCPEASQGLSGGDGEAWRPEQCRGMPPCGCDCRDWTPGSPEPAPEPPARCGKCAAPLSPCAECGKPSQCGDAWCADCTPDGSWTHLPDEDYPRCTLVNGQPDTCYCTSRPGCPWDENDENCPDCGDPGCRGDCDDGDDPPAMTTVHLPEEDVTP